MCECVCVCVCVSWWSLHLSPCPPNATAPAGGSLAYLAAGCPKPASQSDRPCCLSDFTGTMHTIEHQVSLCPHIFSPILLSSNAYSLLCPLIFSLIHSPFLSNTPFFATSLSRISPLTNLPPLCTLISPLASWPLVLASCCRQTHLHYGTVWSLSPLSRSSLLLSCVICPLPPSFLNMLSFPTGITWANNKQRLRSSLCQALQFIRRGVVNVYEH